SSSMGSSSTDRTIVPSAPSPAKARAPNGTASSSSIWPRRLPMARNSAPRSAANVPTGPAEKRVVRCAIYTRKSTEEGLQQEFNSLDAQREAAEAYIASQRGEGWQVGTEHFDDGGYTGGNMDRPALQRLLAAVESRSVDCVVVYKVDRLSRPGHAWPRSRCEEAQS